MKSGGVGHQVMKIASFVKVILIAGAVAAGTLLVLHPEKPGEFMDFISGPEALTDADFKNFSEWDKLSYILNKYRTTDAKVVSDGMEYSPEAAWLKGRKTLIQYARQVQDAAAWIEEYCYRSDEGNIIYFRFPDGKMVPVRDVFLAELALINHHV